MAAERVSLFHCFSVSKRFNCFMLFQSVSCSFSLFHVVSVCFISTLIDETVMVRACSKLQSADRQS